MEQENKVIFDDEKKEEPNKIDEEVTSIIKAADNLINVLEKIAPSINEGKVVNEEAFMKVIKPLCVNVENTLPQLLECVDNLEYLQDERSYVIRQKIAKLEDELLPPIISYIRMREKSCK